MNTRGPGKHQLHEQTEMGSRWEKEVRKAQEADALSLQVLDKATACAAQGGRRVEKGQDTGHHGKRETSFNDNP